MSDITANVVVSMPSQLFTMARSFKAVANGEIYIGKIDTDPVNPENRIQVYVENEDGSHVPVSQPIIINAAGYPVYNGQIARFVTVQGHSMAVYDAYGAQQFYFPNVLKYNPDQFRTLVGDFYGFGYVGGALYNQIREYNGQLDHIYCFGRLSPFDGADGIFYRDDSDAVSADNDGTILVDSLNRRWKRLYEGEINALWFGVNPHGVVSSTNEINNLINSSGDDASIFFPSGTYLSTGLHSLKKGQSLRFDNAIFKSDGTADTHEYFIINEDNVSLLGEFTIDGESRNQGEREPKIAIGIRVGTTRQVSGFYCEGMKGLGMVYPLFITGAKDSTVINCYSYRNNDGFRIASVTSGVAEDFGIDNLLLESCIAEENGIPFMPSPGTMTTESCSGFKVTDVPVSGLTFRNCKAIANCGFGFNLHGHDYTSVPSGFVQRGFYFDRCTSSKNNPPIDNLPTGQTAPTGICSGFYFGAIGVPINDIVLSNCIVDGNYGEAIHSRSLDGTNGVVGLSINNIDCYGTARIQNTTVRTTDSLMRIGMTQDFRINGITLFNVSGLYDFVFYVQSSVGDFSISGYLSGDAPNLIYSQAKSVTYATNRMIIKDINYRKGSNLNSGTTIIGARILDFDEIVIDGVTIQDTGTTAATALSYAIKQEKPNKDFRSFKISNCVLSGTSTTIRLQGSAVDIATLGGSKLFNGNTIYNAVRGFSGNNTENAIIIGNHFDASTVTTAILGFAPSVIKRGNFGLAD